MKLNISLRRRFCRFWRDFFTTDTSGRHTGKWHSKAAPSQHSAKERPHIELPIIKSENS